MLSRIPCLFVLSLCNALVASSSVGFGAQHLQKFGSHVLHREHLNNVKVGSSSCDNVTEYYYKDAVIDNFAPIQYQQKWVGMGQRYWLNKQFWAGPNYPIFVFIGGEGEESCSRLTDYLYMYELAQEHRALMVNVEHRFYGKSIPTTDCSTPNMRYLSSTQALADLARVIDFVKGDLDTRQSAVITVGGSYPGNLAAWFRLKYPSVTQGSIASSAPLNAEPNFSQYMDVVAQSIIVTAGQPCFDAFKLAAEEIANMLLMGGDTVKSLERDFQTCSAMTSSKDQSIFLSDLMGNVQGTVQYNNEHAGTMNISDVCAIMTQSTDAYTNFVSLQAAYRAANGQSCEDGNWDDTVAYLTATGASRSWTYQTCNEFGYFQTADSPNQPFHSWASWLSMDFYGSLCTAAFNGWTAAPQTNWINEQYGSTAIAATNVIFPSGTIDPWHALSISNTSQPQPLVQASEQAAFIEGTAHCKDLYAPNAGDSPQLTYAREQIHTAVNVWLKESAVIKSKKEAKKIGN